MKRFSLIVLCGVCGWSVVSTFSARPALAVKPFRDAWGEMYVKKMPGTDEEKKLSEAFETAKCNLCHLEGKNKKERNAYGQELAKLLKKTDKDDTDKIKKSLKEVEGKPSDAAPGSPTFGDKIKQGKLPADK